MRLLYDDYIFETMLARNYSFLIHHKNMHYLLNRIFKVGHGLADNGILKQINLGGHFRGSFWGGRGELPPV